MHDTVVASDDIFHVLGVNKDRFVIDDDKFTTLQFKDEKYTTYTPFEKAKVYKFNCRPYWDDLRGYMYTVKSRPTAHKAIKKALSEYMHEEYGRYCKGIDLLEKLGEKI
jgi:hypothetical protein